MLTKLTRVHTRMHGSAWLSMAYPPGCRNSCLTAPHHRGCLVTIIVIVVITTSVSVVMLDYCNVGHQGSTEAEAHNVCCPWSQASKAELGTTRGFEKQPGCVWTAAATSAQVDTGIQPR